MLNEISTAIWESLPYLGAAMVGVAVSIAILSFLCGFFFGKSDAS